MKSKTYKTTPRTGPVWALYTAFKKSGAVTCGGCGDWVDIMHVTRCTGIPGCQLVFEGERIAAPMAHHDPINPEWNELEAEDANNQPQGATA